MAKNLTIFFKKARKTQKIGVFALIVGIPTAYKLRSSQKILDWHAFFAGLLHLGQMDETVFGCDFEARFVVGDYAAQGKVVSAFFDFRSEQLHVHRVAIFGMQLGVGGRVGRQASDVVIRSLAILAPVNVAEFLCDFRRGFQGLALKQFFLRQGFRFAFLDLLDGVDHDAVAQKHQFIMEFACGLVGTDANFLAFDDGPFVNLLVEEEGG